MKKVISVALFLLLLTGNVSAAETSHETAPSIGWGIPFILVLAVFAAFPLVPHHAFQHWWGQLKNKLVVLAGLTAIVAAGYMSSRPEALQHALRDYGQFIPVIAAIFMISGGIHVKGNLRGTPIVNTICMAAGFLIAGIGGTLASLVMFYLIARSNRERQRTGHLVVFFIILASNFGGLINPFGNPPNVAAVLRGIPPTWFVEKMLHIWSAGGVSLLVMFFLVDSLLYSKEKQVDLRQDDLRAEPLGLIGGINIILLLGVLGAMAVPSEMLASPLKEMIVLGLGGVSLWYSFTPSGQDARKGNMYSNHGLYEVAMLFAALFITMNPLITYLQANGQSLGLQTASQYYFIPGLCSAWLDNAPTYIIFLEVLKATVGAESGPDIAQNHAQLHAALSAGCNLFGALTYLGNAPNLLVLAIAKNQKLKAPNFFAYILWAGLALGPVLVAINYILIPMIK